MPFFLWWWAKHDGPRMLWSIIREFGIGFRFGVSRRQSLREEKSLREHLSERQIDKMIEDSFPASDPPSTY